jgi:hypothetical protein
MRHALTTLAFVAVALTAHRAVAAELPRATGTVAITTEASRTSVYVGHTGKDAAGRAFVTGLRDAIRTSTQFRLVDAESDASLVLVVVSVSPTSTNRVASAVSLAYVANNEWRSLLGSAARFVGRDRAEAMGRATVAELSAVLAAYDPTAGR